VALAFLCFEDICALFLARGRIVFGEAHLRRSLNAYAAYYNEVRTHPSLSKDAAKFRRVQPVGSLGALPLLVVCIINMFGFEF